MVNTSVSQRQNLALFFVVQLTRKLFKAKKKKKMLVTFGGKSFIARCFGFIGEQIHSQVLGKNKRRFSFNFGVQIHKRFFGADQQVLDENEVHTLADPHLGQILRHSDSFPGTDQ